MSEATIEIGGSEVAFDPALYMSQGDAARRLGVTTARVGQRIDDGEFAPVGRRGRSVYLLRAVVEREAERVADIAERYMTVAEAAKALGVTPQRVRQRVDAGDFAGVIRRGVKKKKTVHILRSLIDAERGG